MAEALIQFVDKVPNTHPLYPLNYLAGDIIAVCPDGWGWTSLELNNQNWRLIKAPGVSVLSISQYANPRLDSVNGLVRKRDVHIALANIPSAILTYLQSNQVLTLTSTQVSNLASWIASHSTILTVG